MLLDDMANWLIDQGLAVDGAIFIGAAPNDPDDLILLNEYAGNVPRFAHDRTFSERPNFQIQVRHTDYPTGRNQIDDIYRSLAAVSNFEIGGTHYKRILPLQSPFELRRDENARIWFVVNFAVEKELSPIV